MSDNFSVSFGKCAGRYYIKNFKKKYKHHWEVTEDAIIAISARIDNFLGTDTCDTIKCIDNYLIAKLDFAVAGTKESPKKSGCRAILYIDQEVRKVEILLLYHKKDLAHINKNETLAWKSLLSDLYPDYRYLL